jgi:laccase
MTVHISMLDFVGTCICSQVSQMNVTRLCKETLVTVVNGQLPGPVIDVTEGDSVVVHVVNKSPSNITIHW